MTGMSLKFFGPGEYPYKNIMLESTCESIPYNLKQIGYGTHAIHNHRGVFYGRNKVFPNLGYDTFTSVEYMNNVGRTPKNWEKDNVLTGEIIDAMESTKARIMYIQFPYRAMENILQSRCLKILRLPLHPPLQKLLNGSTNTMQIRFMKWINS